MAEFLRLKSEEHAQTAESARGILLAEAGRSKQALADAEQALLSFREQNKTFTPDDPQSSLVEQLREIRRKLSAAKGERLRTASEWARVGEAGKTGIDGLLALPGLSRTEEVLAARSRLAGAEAALALVAGRYLPAHPKYTQAFQEAEHWRKKLQEGVEGAVCRLGESTQAALEVEQHLEREERIQQERVWELGEVVAKFQQLTRETAAERALYDGLMSKLRQMALSPAQPAFEARVVSHAEVIEGPRRKGVRRTVLLGCGLGLALGGAVLGVCSVAGGSFGARKEEVSLL